jgi:hypothetical protein
MRPATDETSSPFCTNQNCLTNPRQLEADERPLFLIQRRTRLEALKCVFGSEWLGHQLYDSQRRQIIFMDRNELLDHAAKILLDLKIEEPQARYMELSDDEIPF